jgi:hypothetical protein
MARKIDQEWARADRERARADRAERRTKGWRPSFSKSVPDPLEGTQISKTPVFRTWRRGS